MVLPDGSLFGEGVKTRLKEHLMEECNLHTIVRLPNSVFKPYASIGTNLLFFTKGEPTRDIWFYEHRVPATQKAYSMTKPIRLEHLQPCIDWWDLPNGREENEVAWKVTSEEVKERGYNLDFKNPHVEDDDNGDPEELLAKLEQSEHRTGELRDQLKSILAEGVAPMSAASEMNAKVLLDHFDRISDAPDAVPRLRQFILDLAVRGKLVEQDEGDEPASDLLKAITTIKNDLIAAGEVKKSKGCSDKYQDLIRFSIPQHWLWTCLAEVGVISPRNAEDENKLSSFYTNAFDFCGLWR